MGAGRSFKMTRAERRYHAQRTVDRKLREWKQVTGRPYWGDPGCLRKRHHIFACGTTRCWLCHSEKLAGKPLPRDVKALESARAETLLDPFWDSVPGIQSLQTYETCTDERAYGVGDQLFEPGGLRVL